MKKEASSTQRIAWVVTMRALACLAVVLLHASNENGLELNNAAYMSYRYVVFHSIVPLLTRWAVSFFMMMSGFLLLNPEHDFSLEKAKKGIFRMLRILVVFGFAYCMMEEFFNSGFGAPMQSVIAACRNLLCGNGWDHMWYVYMMVGLYAITPMVRIFVAHVDQRTLH